MKNFIKAISGDILWVSAASTVGVLGTTLGFIGFNVGEASLIANPNLVPDSYVISYPDLYTIENGHYVLTDSIELMRRQPPKPRSIEERYEITSMFCDIAKVSDEPTSLDENLYCPQAEELKKQLQ